MNNTSLLISRVKYLNIAKYGLKLNCNHNNKIVIEKKINRGPTDILHVLSSTVKRDATGAHYKYHDDPYLIPMSNIGKRTFAMAQESGRKAAHWIRQEHAQLFQHEIAEPSIEAFMPKPFYNNEQNSTTLDEETLKHCIQNAQVNNAIIVYEILNKKQIALSDQTLQSMLELFSFFNSTEYIQEELIEERWFRAGNKGKDRLRKTWKDGDIAESIFNQMKNPEGTAYCAIIQGMAKYCQVDKAWKLYVEAKEKNLAVNTDTYNSLIKVASFLKEGYDLRWKLVQDLLITMAKEKLHPNIGTLNAVLETLSTMAGYRKTKDYVLETLSEFKALGVEPSLASWYFILITYCRERSAISHVLCDIIEQVKDKHFSIQDVKDTFFFVTAMDICRNHLHDKDLAMQIHQLLHTGNNYDLMGDSYKESIYYRHYLALLCSTEPLEIFMQHYEKLVPNVYIPEPGIMSEILHAIEINGAIEYIPGIWSDMVLFDHTDRENLLHTILNIMVNNKPPVETSHLNEQFAKIAWAIWTKVNEQHPDRIKKFNMTGDMLGDIMVLCLRANHFNNADLVMNQFNTEPHAIVGVPKVQSLDFFIGNCITQKLPSKAISCVQYCAENGFDEAVTFAKRIHLQLSLDEDHLSKLVHLVGRDFLKEH